MNLERFSNIPRNPDARFATVFSAERNPKRIAVVFPGQGWQKVGMGRDLRDSDDEVRGIYNVSDEILGYKISLICFNGPEDYLNRTLYAQTAIFILNHINYTLLMRSGIRPQFCAGSSLGEYNAVVASGAMSFENMLRVVQARAEATDYASTVYPGGMIAVGVPYEQGEDRRSKRKLLTESVEHFKKIGLFVEAINSEFQIVLSGLNSDIERSRPIMEELKTLGVKIKLLNVRGPFHTPYMKIAEKDLAEALAEAKIQKVEIPMIANTTARIISKPDEIRKELIDHLTMPVRWDDTMKFLNRSGIVHPIEIGGNIILKMRENPRKTAVVVTVVATAAGLTALAYRLKKRSQ